MYGNVPWCIVFTLIKSPPYISSAIAIIIIAEFSLVLSDLDQNGALFCLIWTWKEAENISN